MAPHFFLTARHIGGDTNTPFVFDGTNHYPDAWYDDPAAGSDLRLWHVPGALPRYAPTPLFIPDVSATPFVESHWQSSKIPTTVAPVFAATAAASCT